jgi:hypothetical protein
MARILTGERRVMEVSWSQENWILINWQTVAVGALILLLALVAIITGWFKLIAGPDIRDMRAENNSPRHTREKLDEVRQERDQGSSRVQWLEKEKAAAGMESRKVLLDSKETAVLGKIAAEGYGWRWSVAFPDLAVQLAVDKLEEIGCIVWDGDTCVSLFKARKWLTRNGTVD